MEFYDISFVYSGSLHFANIESDDERGGRRYVCMTYQRFFRSYLQGEDKVIEIVGNPGTMWKVFTLNQKYLTINFKPTLLGYFVFRTL